MKFRQRVAWLLIFLYLLATIAGCYYILEVSERFGRYAVDHVRRNHPTDLRQDAHVLLAQDSDDSEAGDVGYSAGFWHHVADVPLPLLALVGLLLYAQVLCLLCACTRPTFTCHPLLLVVPIAGCIYLHRTVIPSTANHHHHQQMRSPDSIATNRTKLVPVTDASNWLLAEDLAGSSWKVFVPSPSREPVSTNADESLYFLVT